MLYNLNVLDEESSGFVIEKLLALKKEPDQALLELEDNARNLLLEQVSLLLLNFFVCY